jgi:hypothetical protein
MKTYLNFSINGEITEMKTKDKYIKIEDYINYNLFEFINHNKYNLIILYNNDKKHSKNITYLPFYNKEILGDFLLFSVDSEKNIKSLTEKKFLKILNIIQKNIEDYSSDDFNLSE